MWRSSEKAIFDDISMPLPSLVDSDDRLTIESIIEKENIELIDESSIFDGSEQVDCLSGDSYSVNSSDDSSDDNLDDELDQLVEMTELSLGEQIGA